MSDFPVTRRRLLLAAAGSGVVALTACSSPSPGPPTASPVIGTTGGWQQVRMAYVSSYILVRDTGTAIVDLGLAGSSTAIEAGLKAAGTGWPEVRHIFLTHYHDDHIGGLDEIITKIKNATVHAGTNDVGGIISDKPIKPVNDGDQIFGLRVVATPGHTLGHISIFDPATRVLVAGDALRTTNGLEGSDPEFTADPDQAADSVRKLARLDVTAILPGHLDPLLTDAAAALSRLAAASPTD